MMILKWQPPGAVTGSVTSVKGITDTYQRWKGGLGTKTAKIKKLLHAKEMWEK